MKINERAKAKSCRFLFFKIIIVNLKSSQKRIFLIKKLEKNKLALKLQINLFKFAYSNNTLVTYSFI